MVTPVAESKKVALLGTELISVGDKSVVQLSAFDKQAIVPVIQAVSPITRAVSAFWNANCLSLLFLLISVCIREELAVAMPTIASTTIIISVIGNTLPRWDSMPYRSLGCLNSIFLSIITNEDGRTEDTTPEIVSSVYIDVTNGVGTGYRIIVVVVNGWCPHD